MARTPPQIGAGSGAVRRSRGYSRPIRVGPGSDPSVAELDRAHRERSSRAAALDPEVEPAPDDVADEEALEVADPFDRLAVELDHDVADAQPGARGRSGLEELDDLEPAGPTDSGGHGVRQRTGAADDAEERPTNTAVDDEGVEDAPRRRVDRDRETEADPGDRGVDADDPAACVRERAARVARVERGVRLDDVLDETAGPAVAGRERSAEGADDAGRHGPGEAQRVAD